ncbi:ABC transporter substrate-binding protein [Saccharibacillus sp. CPCC 101409]|uniref:ABC transporter substrate-binding protein n=1 Tax=Saccharibacillus sp. CPCC 101409 TaxID=3058041 RepID=UPI0026714D5A|nr:ABC transporter substrate-binding protein [Saccharibacillus sp. CPCC 101409]MDO3413339.1 ABC transporter substrate-binding protein [Saccharibacillus sp. CPCC 101409]
MVSKKAKWVAPVALASIVGLTACGGGSSSSDDKAAADTENGPITFSLFSADSNNNWANMQDEVGKKITEKTGVTLNAEYAVGGDTQKVSLMIASGEYPDLIMPKGDTTKLVEADALVDLTDLIDKYAPNIKKLYENDMNRLKFSKEDPSIYIIPTYSGVGQTSFDAGGGFELQLEVLKELGYPEIRTLDDYEKALKEYYAKNPTINGQPTIPLSLNADDWKIMIGVTNPAFLATGLPDNGEFYINPETYEAQLHYKRPEEKEYFRWLNKMYNEGLLDKETFTQKSDQYLAKISSGRVLGTINQEWDYSEAENTLKASSDKTMQNRIFGHFPVTLNTEYKDHSFMDVGFPGGYGIGITTNLSEAEQIRAIKFLDWMASEEGQVLNNWGIEGEQYKVENGKRVIPQEVQDRKTSDNAAFTKETGIGMYTLMSPHYGDGVKDSTDNYYTTNFPEQIQAAYTQPEKDALKEYGAQTWKDIFPPADELGTSPWGAAYNLPAPTDPSYTVGFQKSQDIVRKRIPEAILASPDKFDGIFDGMIEELNAADIVAMEKMFTQQIKNTVELYEGK